MTEFILAVTEDEVDGRYLSTAVGHSVRIQGDSVEESRSNVNEVIDCYFDDTMLRPRLIRMRFEQDGVPLG